MHPEPAKARVGPQAALDDLRDLVHEFREILLALARANCHECNLAGEITAAVAQFDQAREEADV